MVSSGVMAVPIRRGGDWPAGTSYPIERGRPPARGDLIVMTLPDGEPAPAGWTRVAGGCWRYADGTETVFPFPAAWFTGAEPAKLDEPIVHDGSGTVARWTPR